jgi:FkbM family methyltransferase
MYASYDGFTYMVNDDGFKYHIDNGICEPYPRHIEIVKRYQNEYPNKNNTYIDIGAHIGTTVLPFSRLYKSIYAFEANKDNYKLLEENVKMNSIGHCKLYNTGVYNKSTLGKMLQHGNNSGCFYFKETDDGDTRTIKIDDILNDSVKVDFIKIDTEGSELYVIQGAEKCLHANKPLIQIELNGLSKSLYNIEDSSVLSYLGSLGYQIYDSSISGNIFLHKP